MVTLEVFLSLMGQGASLHKVNVAILAYSRQCRILQIFCLDDTTIMAFSRAQGHSAKGLYPEITPLSWLHYQHGEI